MTGKQLWHGCWCAVSALAILAAGQMSQVLLAQEISIDLEPPGGVNCTFKSEPDRFLEAEMKVHQAAFERGRMINTFAGGVSQRNASLAAIPRVNYIDNQIFDRMMQAGVTPAPLSGDYEFVRRIYLDLTGRIPTPAQVRDFVNDSSPGKRDRLIDSLLYSPEFSYKWLIWLGDVMQNSAANSFRSIQVNGRNAYYYWLLSAVSSNKSLKDVVWEALTSKGNNYLTASANWNVRSGTGGGPAQDTYDTAFSRSAAQFLGMSHYDCILCHNGRGHLEGLSVWGARATRVEAQRMAAFYSRMRLNGVTNDQANPLFNSTEVVEAATGQYDLNTTFGNRPLRVAIGSTRSLTPQWRDGKDAPAREWMGAFADSLVTDRMFARNFANRIWKQLFNMGLVEPVDQLDPARLDPANVPEGTTLQATHPVLLEEMADHLVALNFGLREFVRVLVTSSAYQLSSRYDGEWTIASVPLFARHYARRLEGEEIHDSLQVATGVMGSYTVRSWSEPVRWALQLPEPAENTAASGFMNAFFRGNRDTLDRTQQGSILQQMSLMNDGQVLNRIRVAASAPLRQIATNSDDRAAIDQLFLLFLSRLPSAAERETSTRHLASRGAANRNSAFEDLAWALVNRPEFIFSY